MAKVERLFQCVVCPAAFVKKQSLRAHMKVHKKAYLRTSIFARRDLWERFNQVCESHKTTSCHVLNALIEAVVQGEKVGVVDLAKIASPNPIVINLTHNFLGLPRGSRKVQVPGVPGSNPGCRLCGSLDVYEWQPELSNLLQGRCKKCGAEWLVGPGPRGSREISLPAR